MQAATQTTRGARSIFGGIIVSSILGTEDRTDIEELAKRLFLSPTLGLDPGDSKKLGEVPAVKSAVERAAKLNARKHAVLDRLTACRKSIPFAAEDMPEGFHAGFPRRLRHLDPDMYRPWCYQPINWNGDPMARGTPGISGVTRTKSPAHGRRRRGLRAWVVCPRTQSRNSRVWA
jgi:hypothetical protein